MPAIGILITHITFHDSRALVVTTKAPSVAKAVDVPVAAESVEAAEGTDL